MQCYNFRGHTMNGTHGQTAPAYPQDKRLSEAVRKYYEKFGTSKAIPDWVDGDATIIEAATASGKPLPKKKSARQD